MKNSWIILLALLVGCANPGEVTVQPAQQPPVQLLHIAFDDRVEDGDLALIQGATSIYIGDTKEDTIALSSPPKKKWDFSALPPQFGENFSAAGWESDNGHSFGCIAFLDPEWASKEEEVVLVMSTRDDVDQETVDKTVAQYSQRFGEPLPANVLPGARVAYWFWVRGDRRLMIHTSLDAKGKRELVVAVGAPMVMTELGMSPERASEDKDLAIQRLTQAAGG